MNIKNAVLVVIPARGGSKGIPKKNLSLLHGKTLTEWAILSAFEINYEKKIILSSDSQDILDLSMKFDEVIPSRRPLKLSGDFVADFQVLRHELEQAEARELTKFECIVMLQPTSPIRNFQTLNRCVDAVFAGHSSAWTVAPVPVKFHPRKQLTLLNQSLRLEVDSPLVVARQELGQTFIRTGVCYALSRETVLNDETLLGKNALSIFCDWPSVNIDEPEDLIKAQNLSVYYRGRLRPIGE